MAATFQQSPIKSRCAKENWPLPTPSLLPPAVASAAKLLLKGSRAFLLRAGQESHPGATSPKPKARGHGVLLTPELWKCTVSAWGERAITEQPRGRCDGHISPLPPPPGSTSPSPDGISLATQSWWPGSSQKHNFASYMSCPCPTSASGFRQGSCHQRGDRRGAPLRSSSQTWEQNGGAPDTAIMRLF